MKKTALLAALLASTAAFSTAQAALEVRSSFADEHGIILVELVDTQTQEVVETRTFQSDYARSVVDGSPDVVASPEEDTTTVEAGDPVTSDDAGVHIGDDNHVDTDESSGSVGGSAVSSGSVDVHSDQEKVDGVWKKAVAALTAAATYLEQQVQALEAKAGAVFSSESDTSATAEATEESDAPTVEEAGALDVQAEATEAVEATVPAEVQPVK